MTKYLEKLWEEMDKFEEFKIEQIPKEQNLMVDQLAKLASSNQFTEGRRITLLSAAKPMVNSEEEKKEEIEGVLVEENLTLTWRTPIVHFLTEGILPKDHKEARKVKVRSARFIMIGGDLYKRGFSSPLLKCLNPDRGEYVLREIHEGSCGNHSGARSLARSTKARLLLVKDVIRRSALVNFEKYRGEINRLSSTLAEASKAKERLEGGKKEYTPL
ncbi:UNVERIFIED_CONTAM: hypothetical protein Sradi_1753200 [Sesamum radiatum]|uniref:Uncharacterized protein n=1 Tax=Sesamum radiatum TaxID=300843 RepID=A0AAW2TUJ1_SESRA